MTPVVPHIVNNISYVTRISHDSHFAWQAQYSLMLEDDTCYSAHCINNVSYVTRINRDSNFAWQAQYLVMLNYHFLWQAQYSVKFGMITRAGNVAFFNRKFGEVQVSLFVAGAAFGEVQVSLFVAGAAFGEVQVSHFVAGAVFGEIWNDSRRILSEILESHFAWQAQYSVMFQ